jgi:lipoprotein-anchoring transpeptidase ErfK/SrfK
LLGWGTRSDESSMLPRPRPCVRRVTKGNTDAPCTADAGDGSWPCRLRPHAPDPTTPPDQGVYGARTDSGPNGEPIEIHAVRPAYLTESNRRQRVAYNGPEAPGTIVVDPYARFLYHVLEMARPCVSASPSVRPARTFRAMPSINRKQAWPSWTPTANMVRTQPELYGPLKGGLRGGVDNPLGSRALYLYRGGRDTMYRIHGTMDPSSIGKATSAGCIRLFNQDIMDLFDEIPNGTRSRSARPAKAARLRAR